MADTAFDARFYPERTFPSLGNDGCEPDEPLNLNSLTEDQFCLAQNSREGSGSEKRRHRETPDAKADLSKTLPPESNLKEGDIIFQSSSAFDEAKAIQIVSKSPMTHCGILFKEGKDWYVYEALDPIAKTPLKDFAKTADGQTYAVRRLRDEDALTADALKKMRDYLDGNIGKPYDHKFGWGNDKQYCSELVWKAYYEATKQKIGKIRMVGDFDLSDPLVKKLVEQRYGKDVPTTEPTVTPGDVYNSRKLKTVK